MLKLLDAKLLKTDDKFLINNHLKSPASIVVMAAVAFMLEGSEVEDVALITAKHLEDKSIKTSWLAVYFIITATYWGTIFASVA